MATRSGSGQILRRYFLRLVVVAVVAAVFYYGDQARKSQNELPGPNGAPVSPAAPNSETNPSLEIDKKDDTTRIAPRDASRKSKARPSDEQLGSQQTSESLVMRGLELRDESGDVLYRGDIDLKPTIDRVAAGNRLRFRNDGSTFQNREARLPRKSAGYYREWVVPTPGDDGPGPQRLVTGKEGEVWYTPDHYRSFRRIPYQFP